MQGLNQAQTKQINFDQAQKKTQKTYFLRTEPKEQDLWLSQHKPSFLFLIIFSYHDIERKNTKHA